MMKSVQVEEGLNVGVQSGAVLVSLIKFLKTEKLDQDKNVRCKLLFSDNFLSEISTETEQHEEQVQEEQEAPKSIFDGKTIEDYDFKPTAYYDKRLTISDCFDLLNKN